MISKWKVNLMAFLLFLTLFSVGFSSWQITGSVTRTQNGLINVDKVETSYTGEPNTNLFSFFSSTSSPLQFFDFDNTTFYDEFGRPTTNATISADFFVNISYNPDRWQDCFSGANSLSFNFSLSALNTTDGINPFQYCSSLSPTASITSFGSSVGAVDIENAAKINFSSCTIEDNEYKFSINLDGILSEDYKIQDVAPEYIILRANFNFQVSKANYGAFYAATLNNPNFKFSINALAAGYISKSDT